MQQCILTNAFSLNMLKGDVRLRFERMSEEAFREAINSGPITSAVGYPATANVLTRRLGVEVLYNRTSVVLEPEMHLYVAQVSLPRLAEGQILSEEEVLSAPIEYWHICQE